MINKYMLNSALRDIEHNYSGVTILDWFMDDREFGDMRIIYTFFKTDIDKLKIKTNQKIDGVHEIQIVNSPDLNYNELLSMLISEIGFHSRDEAITDQTLKADDSKAKLSLVPQQILYDIAHAREYGVSKYGSVDSWKKVELIRWVDALLRHTSEFIRDNNSVDSESGIEHYKHMACNIAFICEMMK